MPSSVVTSQKLYEFPSAVKALWPVPLSITLVFENPQLRQHPATLNGHNLESYSLKMKAFAKNYRIGYLLASFPGATVQYQWIRGKTDYIVHIPSGQRARGLAFVLIPHFVAYAHMLHHTTQSERRHEPQ